MDKDLPGTGLANERCCINADVPVVQRKRHQRLQVHESTVGQIRCAAASRLASGNRPALLSNVRRSAAFSYALIRTVTAH